MEKAGVRWDAGLVFALERDLVGYPWASRIPFTGPPLMRTVAV